MLISSHARKSSASLSLSTGPVQRLTAAGLALTALFAGNASADGTDVADPNNTAAPTSPDQ
ncbi:MAG TPA: hypothetical protein VK753_11005, partial [Xanthomonadaceae bacterium]|nr:hypothetical protein [Xanthomonadaceae bacterium]